MNLNVPFRRIRTASAIACFAVVVTMGCDSSGETDLVKPSDDMQLNEFGETPEEVAAQQQSADAYDE